MTALIFGRSGNWCDRHQGAMVAGVLFCICTIDYLVGLA